ncbi:hypothetical protein CABS03_12524 [Colletotrichum abscissum]
MSQTPLIMMVFGDRRRLTARPETYHQLMDDARNAFGSKAVNLTVHCTSKSREPEFELDQSAYRAVEDGWVLRLEPKAAPIIKLESLLVINVNVRTLTGETFSLRISPAATVEELETAVEARTDLDKAAKSSVTLNPNTIAEVFLVFRGVVSV